jgi:hypothetical protein
VVRTTDPHGHILCILDRSSYYFQVTLQLYSRGLVDLVPDPQLLIRSGSAENRTRDLYKPINFLHRGSPCHVRCRQVGIGRFSPNPSVSFANPHSTTTAPNSSVSSILPLCRLDAVSVVKQPNFKTCTLRMSFTNNSDITKQWTASLV